MMFIKNKTFRYALGLLLLLVAVTHVTYAFLKPKVFVSPQPLRHGVDYHLAITTCARPYAGRYLSLLLLSILGSGNRPLTISIVHCHKLEQKGRGGPKEALNSSFWGNLHLMPMVRFIPLPDDVPEPSPVATYMTALRVPDILAVMEGNLGYKSVPVVVVEDDIVFAPSFGQQFSSTYKQILEMAQSHGKSLHPAFMASYYNPGVPGAAATLLEGAAHMKRKKRKLVIRSGASAWGYGVQASPMS